MPAGSPLTLRLATRRSLLARRQSQIIAAALETSSGRRLCVDLVPFVTRGDVVRGTLADAGGKGLFTSDLEEALRRGEVDLAVHSAKDLPAAMDADFALVVPQRGDPRDAIVSRHGQGLEALPRGATVGTGSPRRARQLQALRSDLRIVPIRGNVDTRLVRAVTQRDDALDAVVLAMAGLERLELLEPWGRCVTPLEVNDFIPAGGQGALAVQYLTLRNDVASLLAGLEDADSRSAVEAERHVLRAVQASCHSCIGVHVAGTGDRWSGQAMAGPRDGGEVVRLDVQGGSAAQAASALAEEMLTRGVGEWL